VPAALEILKETMSMIYELRVYEAMPGKLPALNARFENHTRHFFAKHGIQVIGFWTTLIGPSAQDFTYLLAYDSLADREQKWTAFSTDPEWLAIKRESEKEGALWANIRNQLLAPTKFSPLQ
jgi:hypothetical protein